MLKLGTGTGSLMNHVASRCAIPDVISIGDGATLLGWSDRHACTVVEVFKKGKFDYIVVQQDIATRTDDNGISEQQSYSYEPDLDGNLYTFRIKNNNFEGVRLNENNRYVKSSRSVVVGERDEYYDFSM